MTAGPEGDSESPIGGRSAGLEGSIQAPVGGRSALIDDETSSVQERRARRQEFRQRRRRTRALAIDVLVAGGLAALVLALAPGLGVVLFFALPILVILGLWAGGERLVGGRRERARARRDARSAHGGRPPVETAPREPAEQGRR